MNDEPEKGDRRKATRKPLRWLYAAGVLCTITIVGLLLWGMFRPLNVMERRLVGTWRNKTLPAVFRFNADRSITAAGPTPGGRWYVSDNTLYTPDTPLNEAIQTLFRRRVQDSSVLTFEDDDNISVFVPINGGTFHWERVDSK